jgi:hypothetical protein
MNQLTLVRTYCREIGYGYLAQSAAQISRHALASGLRGVCGNRGLAPNAAYFERIGASRR